LKIIVYIVRGYDYIIHMIKNETTKEGGKMNYNKETMSGLRLWKRFIGSDGRIWIVDNIVTNPTVRARVMNNGDVTYIRWEQGTGWRTSQGRKLEIFLPSI
jgi:hypothetical protein